jgi:hypothetical protein
MTEPHSQLEIADGIATFTMTRPEARNALSLQVRDEIAAMIETVRGDDEIKALIITGSGGVFAPVATPRPWRAVWARRTRYAAGCWMCMPGWSRCTTLIAR